MKKLMNKKTLTIILLAGGIVAIAVAFFLIKDDPVEPKPKPDDTTTPIVPDNGDVVIPDNPDVSDPDYVSIDPLDPVEPDDGDGTTPPVDDSEPEDTSGFPKPGDNIVEPESVTETLYKETFDNPINPDAESEEHKEVYEKVQDFVHFTIKYPTWLPEGFMMTEVDADEGEEPEVEGQEYYGVNIFVYETDDKKIEILQGYIDLGFVISSEKVEISEGRYVLFWPGEYGGEDTIGLTLTDDQDPSDYYDYYIIGKNVSEQTLVDVAKNLKIF